MQFIVGHLYKSKISVSGPIFSKENNENVIIIFKLWFVALKKRWKMWKNNAEWILWVDINIRSRLIYGEYHANEWMADDKLTTFAFEIDIHRACCTHNVNATIQRTKRSTQSLEIIVKMTWVGL